MPQCNHFHTYYRLYFDNRKTDIYIFLFDWLAGSDINQQIALPSLQLSKLRS